LIPSNIPPTNSPFENRSDAGSKLAEKLQQYRGAVVLAIPNGGVPLAIPIAMALGGDLDVVISRKLPIPLRPEGGFGAVADNGMPIFNEIILRSLNLSEYDVNYIINKVRLDIQHRTKLYKGNRPPTLISGRTVVLVDDGLATGYTMLAAIQSIKRRNPKEIIVTAPSSSIEALNLVRKENVRVVLGFEPSPGKYYVSAAYKNWSTVSDEEVVRRLNDWYTRLHRPQFLRPNTYMDNRGPLY
jgi:predicted phosphoribosyltransferase